MADRRFEELIESPPSAAKRFSIKMTSGTRHAPMSVPMEHSDRITQTFKGQERVCIGLGSLNYRLANVLFSRSSITPVRVLTLDNSDISYYALQLVKDFSPRCLRTTPSTALRVGQVYPAAFASVRTLSLTSEYVSRNTLDLLALLYLNAHVQISYVATEVGLIGDPACQPFLPNFYHPALGVHIEISKPDHDGVGEIAVSVHRNSIHVDDYRIGDMGRIVKRHCICGKQTFEVLRRAGRDYITLLGAIMRRDEFDRVCGKFPDLIDDYRAELSEKHTEKSVLGHVRLTIFRAAGDITPALKDELAQKISQSLFVTSTLTLSKLIARGNFEPLEIEFTLKPFPLENKETKLFFRHS